MSDRLFVPLKNEHYRNFEDCSKLWELRGVNDQFNTDTVRPGYRVELRRGYSTDDSLWGSVAEVETFDTIEAVPEKIDHELILPGSTESEFLESARSLLGDYGEFIAFRVCLEIDDGPADIRGSGGESSAE